MSGLQNFLAPFSHLLFANRNLTIGLLCFVLFLVALDALIHRWHRRRLEHELASARTSGASSGGRRYANAHAPEEAPVETGALPPVKGGRTYARNLGSALQKAGMSSQQIYSPPTPPGWAQHGTPPQPTQPSPPQPYAQPNVPWAAPTAPPQSPWGVPAGAGRGVPPAAPNPAPPFYQPQPTSPQQPLTPPAMMPGLYGPQMPPTFGPPPFQTAAAATPTPAPSGMLPVPQAPLTAPVFGSPPVILNPEPAAQEGARRGKPKRRRFGLSVLENLEKIVQARASEAPPAPSWTPPAAPAEAGMPPAAGAGGAMPDIRLTQPKVGPPAAAGKAGEETTLPLRFGPPVEAEVASEPAPVEAEPVASGEANLEPAASSPESEPEATTKVPEPEPELKPEARRSMRSMLFGQETRSEPSEAKSEPALSRHEPVWPQSSLGGNPWGPAEETPAVDETAPTEMAPAGEPARDSAADAESTGYPSDGADVEVVEPAESESEPSAEPAPASIEVSESDESRVDTPEPAAEDAGDRPNAGTLVIIEDDQTAASYYATLFRGNGYRVEVANDGVSGVDLCARVQPQVILLDVMMPRQNGILVLQTLRASDETKNTPVVVMSNFSEPTLIKRALQLGALEYVIKTQVEGPALLSALPRWMNREKAFAAA